MLYIYETHLHTSEASGCGRVPGRDYIAYMKQLGYSGIIVTDHFFNGNTCIPKDLPWETRIQRYCLGYQHAKEEAFSADPDFSVFFGLEVNFEGDEYLLYGVDEDWLSARPDLLSYDRHALYDAVHAAGGLMIQAHPYRERNYLSKIHLSPFTCDGVEVYNAANQSYMNALACAHAQKYQLLTSAGSDIHFFGEERMGGVAFTHPIHTIQEFIHCFLAGEAIPVARIEDGSFVPVTQLTEECITETKPYLEVVLHP